MGDEESLRRDEEAWRAMRKLEGRQGSLTGDEDWRERLEGRRGLKREAWRAMMTEEWGLKSEEDRLKGDGDRLKGKEDNVSKLGVGRETCFQAWRAMRKREEEGGGSRKWIGISLVPFAFLLIASKTVSCVLCKFFRKDFLKGVLRKIIF